MAGLSEQSEQYPVVVFSSQSWEEPLKTNRHRISAEAARRGSQVLFVETEPWFGRRGLLRGVRDLWQATVGGCRSVGQRLYVVSALNLLPGTWRYPWIGRLQSRFQAPFLRAKLRRLGWADPIALVYDPRAATLAARINAAAVVYDCVDAHEASYPPEYRRAVADYDQRAAQVADAVTATTESLVARHAANNSNTQYVPNVADFGHFSRAVSLPDPRNAQPVIGFVGNMLPVKLDFDLVREVAVQRPEWHFRLVGPVQPDARDAVRRLDEYPNISFVGLVDYDDLPEVLRTFDVAMIPYRVNKYTDSCFPLKTYEYLAAGLPIVASGLQSLPALEPDVVVARGAREFESAIAAHLDSPRSEADVQRRQAEASGHTWEVRTDSVMSAAVAAARRNA